mgnify:CR=1 FL=1
MIRALLFDLDDTLLDHTGAARDAVDQWCRELGLPEGQHARFAAIERTWFSAYERGEVTHQGQRAARCREFLSREMNDAEALAAYDGYLSAYREQWRAFADALPTLTWALESGFQVGILTNGVLLIPAVDLGCPKPQRAAYLAACRQLGVDAADTLMVGDSLTNDVQGARKAGLHALHLDRTGKGDLSSLSALREVLPQRAS